MTLCQHTRRESVLWIIHDARMAFRSAVLGCILILASLCYNSTVFAKAVDNASTVPAGSTEYRLGVNDKVRVIVFNEPTLSGEFTVSDGGYLSLPLIGEVQAAGRSLREISSEVEKKFADGYLVSPKISIDILTYRPYFILGEVNKPGEYPYITDMTVTIAVARAEGFTYRANKKKVFIKHIGDSEEHFVEITPNLEVQPGDTIRIGERYF